MLMGLVIGFFAGLSLAIISGNIVHKSRLKSRVHERGFRFLDTNGAELSTDQFLVSVFNDGELYE